MSHNGTLFNVPVCCATLCSPFAGSDAWLLLDIHSAAVGEEMVEVTVKAALVGDRFTTSVKISTVASAVRAPASPFAGLLTLPTTEEGT